MTVSRSQVALRTVAKYLWLIGEGRLEIMPAEAKSMSAMCWLALPMKLRMTKQEMRSSEPQNQGKVISISQLLVSSGGTGGGYKR